MTTGQSLPACLAAGAGGGLHTRCARPAPAGRRVGGDWARAAGVHRAAGAALWRWVAVLTAQRSCLHKRAATKVDRLNAAGKGKAVMHAQGGRQETSLSASTSNRILQEGIRTPRNTLHRVPAPAHLLSEKRVWPTAGCLSCCRQPPLPALALPPPPAARPCRPLPGHQAGPQA